MKTKRLPEIVATMDDVMREQQQLAKDLLRTRSAQDQAEIAARILPMYEAVAARHNDMIQFLRALKVGATSAV